MGALLLDSINQPRDLKQLNEQQVKQLCAEIRQFLLENISKTGGHLASNLGVVELTVALHRVLDTPQDKIVFDVGHQCYTHKILTGRRGQFDKLRQLDGISGFPNPNESEHDAFIAGHGNTALSLAIGMAWAKKLHHEAGLVVAVIGDGAFTGGMVYEGMNNIEQLDNLLVILNDNKMSISKNVGALAPHLSCKLHSDLLRLFGRDLVFLKAQIPVIRLNPVRLAELFLDGNELVTSHRHIAVDPVAEKLVFRFLLVLRIGKHIFERLIIFGRIFGVGGLFRIGRIVQYLTEPDAYLPKLCYCHFNPLFSGRRNSRSIAA